MVWSFIDMNMDAKCGRKAKSIWLAKMGNAPEDSVESVGKIFEDPVFRQVTQDLLVDTALGGVSGGERLPAPFGRGDSGIGGAL